MLPGEAAATDAAALKSGSKTATILAPRLRQAAARTLPIRPHPTISTRVPVIPSV
jgi:hypothetical protein